jgi:hypothetical protein
VFEEIVTRNSFRRGTKAPEGASTWAGAGVLLGAGLAVGVESVVGHSWIGTVHRYNLAPEGFKYLRRRSHDKERPMASFKGLQVLSRGRLVQPERGAGVA